LLAALTALYAALVWLALWASGRLEFWHPLVFQPYYAGYTALWLVGLFAVAFGNATIRRTFTAERMLGGALIYVLGVLTGGVFGAAKQAMFPLVLTGWDEPLMRLNVWLHGGLVPGRWLATHLPTPVIVALDWFYLPIWAHVGAFTTIAFTWSGHSRRRQQFMIGQLLLWSIGGTLLAALFASGGPCYYDDLTGAPIYRTAFARLDSIQGGLIARRVQEHLWAAVTSGEWQPFSGVSAMPSMHVAMSAYVAAAWWRHGLWARIAGVIFSALTLVGSIALGWHYAIDGYVSIVLAPICWWAAGRVVQKRTSSSRGLPNVPADRPRDVPPARHSVCTAHFPALAGGYSACGNLDAVLKVGSRVCDDRRPADEARGADLRRATRSYGSIRDRPI
jgi:hypothetical protein